MAKLCQNERFLNGRSNGSGRKFARPPVIHVSWISRVLTDVAETPTRSVLFATGSCSRCANPCQRPAVTPPRRATPCQHCANPDLEPDATAPLPHRYRQPQCKEEDGSGSWECLNGVYYDNSCTVCGFHLIGTGNLGCCDGTPYHPGNQADGEGETCCMTSRNT